MNRIFFLLIIYFISRLAVLSSINVNAQSGLMNDNESVIVNSYSYNNTSETPPDPPLNLSILETDFDYIYIIWEDASDNETAFIIERHSEEDDFADYDTVSANTNNYLDYRVKPYTYYYYRVKAINAEGESAPSNEAGGQTKSLPHSPPREPSNLQGVVNGTTHVILTWDDKSDNENAFYIYRGSTPSVIEFLDSVDSNTTEYIDYQIESGHTYYYYIASSNAFGVSVLADSIKINVEYITELEIPQLTILSTNHNSIHLTWDSIAGNSIQYQLFRISDNDDTILIDLIEGNEFIDQDLSSNTSYNYQVLASDTLLNQSLSNVAKAKTLPAFVANRASDSLIAMFILSERSNEFIPDYSWYGNPVRLNITDTLTLTESSEEALKIRTPNTLVSLPEYNHKISEACKLTNEISIECWLKTSEHICSEISTVLAFGNDTTTAFSLNSQPSHENINKIAYSVNLSTRSTNQNGFPTFDSKAALYPNVLNHILFSHNKSGEEKFYINGKLVAEGYRPSGFENWLDTYTLVLANDLNNQKPWLGELYLCSIYNTALEPEDVSSNYIASPFAQDDFILNSVNYEMHISPNPATDHCNLVINNSHQHSEITEKYFVLIVNQYGQVVDEIIVSEYLNGESLEIEIDHLPSGIYSVNLYNQHVLIDNQKLLITQ